MDLAEGIVLWMILAVSVSLHECGHAYSADRLGDPLPRQQGRVTLNPFAHMDPIGTGLIPFIMIVLLPGGISIFGWGKPVMISLPNPKTRVRDDLIITACGPLVNIAIAFVGAIVGGLAYRLGLVDLKGLCEMVIYVNVMLFVFNMMPIPPLDGSHFLRRAINMSDETYMQLSQYGFIILLVAINLPPVRQVLGAVMMLLSAPFYAIMGAVAG